MEKRSVKKSIGNILFFLILIYLTFYIIFKNQNPNEILKILRSVDLNFIRNSNIFYVFIFYM